MEGLWVVLQLSRDFWDKLPEQLLVALQLLEAIWQVGQFLQSACKRPFNDSLWEV